MPQLSSEASDFSWLVDNFANHTPGVAHAMVVSADGLPIAVSERLDRPKADQLAAIACGLASLTQGSARCIDGGPVQQTVIEMDRGLQVRWDRDSGRWFAFVLLACVLVCFKRALAGHNQRHAVV